MKDRIRAENKTAQLQYRPTGNPPGTLPHSAVSNAYPGLELDFRNVWKRILVGIELHESSNFVVSVDDSAPEDIKELRNNYQLLTVQDVPVTGTVTGPLIAGGDNVPLPDPGEDSRLALEWSNALAGVLHSYEGKGVECEFATLDSPMKRLRVTLKVRPFFEEGSAVIARDIAEPGALTQSLCSPWQNDYRECGCFYWAASRPDFVNVEIRDDGSSGGNNWMQKNRTSDSAKVYIVDDWLDERLLTHADLLRDWERALRFVFGNKDEPLPPGSLPR
jgi:hypothetical protein